MKYFILLLLVVGCATKPNFNNNYQHFESDSLAIISGDIPGEMQAHSHDIRLKGDISDVKVNDLTIRELVFKINFIIKKYNTKNGELVISGILRNSESDKYVGGMLVELFDSNNTIASTVTDKEGVFKLVCTVESINYLRIKFTGAGYANKFYSVKKLFAL